MIFVLKVCHLIVLYISEFIAGWARIFPALFLLDIWLSDKEGSLWLLIENKRGKPFLAFWNLRRTEYFRMWQVEQYWINK
jgi:hypothetical protein